MGLFQLAILLFVKLILLFLSMVLLGAKIFAVITSTWLQLGKPFIKFQAYIFWKLVIWSIAFVMFPIRVMTALHRERRLVATLDDVRMNLEDVIWVNEELLQRLKMAVKDRKVMETIFTELEDDYEEAVIKMNQLENKLKVTKEENRYLSEVPIRSHWNCSSEKDSEKPHEGVPVGIAYGAHLWDSSYDNSSTTFNDKYDLGYVWEDRSKHRGSDITKSELKEALLMRKNNALSQSIFTAILSLIVGATIWEADDPCTPLLAALFIVVGMSLISVVQLFSTIDNRPALDAVILLSLNWFMLGTLTSSMLPRVALSVDVMRLSSHSP